MGLHGTSQHDTSSSVRERIGVRPPETSDQEDSADQDGGLVPSEAAVDTLDQEDFRAPAAHLSKKKPIVSVHGRDVKEEDLDKAA